VEHNQSSTCKVENFKRFETRTAKPSFLLNIFVFYSKGLACWPLVPKFAGSNPAEAIGFLKAKVVLDWVVKIKSSVPAVNWNTTPLSSSSLPSQYSVELSNLTLRSLPTECMSDALPTCQPAWLVGVYCTVSLVFTCWLCLHTCWSLCELIMLECKK
jgi:hypothetical protein